MLPPGNEVRRLKYYAKGQKLYAPVILSLHGRTRILRLSARTADVAMRYGQAVLARYRHWCDIALAKEMEK